MEKIEGGGIEKERVKKEIKNHGKIQERRDQYWDCSFPCAHLRI